MDHVTEALVILALIAAILLTAGDPDIIDAIRDRIRHGTCQPTQVAR